MPTAIAQILTPLISGNSGGTGVLAMILDAGPMVRAIMAGLMGLSLVSWGIIVTKLIELSIVDRESGTFLKHFTACDWLSSMHQEAELLKEGHLPHIFRTGYGEIVRVTALLAKRGVRDIPEKNRLLIDNVGRAVQSGVISKRKRLQRLLPFLATTGGVAPFVGLFGTVWGIMASFQEIGLKGSANLAVVAPGISEALVATAMGLAAAIPAVVAYNYFFNRILFLEDDMLQFASDFLNMLNTDLICLVKQEETVSDQAAREGACLNVRLLKQ